MATTSKSKTAKSDKKVPAPKEITAEIVDSIDDEEAAAELLEKNGIEFDEDMSLDELKGLLRENIASDGGDDDEDDEKEAPPKGTGKPPVIDDDDDEDSDDDDEADEAPARPVEKVLGTSAVKAKTYQVPRGLADVKVGDELKGASVVAVIGRSREEIRRYSASRHGKDFAKLAVLFAGKESGRTVVAVK